MALKSLVRKARSKMRALIGGKKKRKAKAKKAKRAKTTARKVVKRAKRKAAPEQVAAKRRVAEVEGADQEGCRDGAGFDAGHHPDRAAAVTVPVVGPGRRSHAGARQRSAPKPIRFSHSGARRKLKQNP